MRASPLYHSGHATDLTMAVAPIVLHTQVKHEPLEGGNDMGLGGGDRITRVIFVLPYHYGYTKTKEKAKKKTKKKTKKKNSKKKRENSDMNESVRTDARDDESDSSDEDAEAEVSHLRKTRPLTFLFVQVRYYNIYCLENNSGRYDLRIARIMTIAGRFTSLQMIRASFSIEYPNTVMRFLLKLKRLVTRTAFTRA